MASLAIAGHDIAGFGSVHYPFDGTALAQTIGCTVRKGTIDAQPSLINFSCKDIDDVKSKRA
jgi:[methyl-Co(III) methanol-specific corrinoid protein]:coenzyme M methyltransferase